jgi:hypothetical protein
MVEEITSFCKGFAESIYKEDDSILPANQDQNMDGITKS